MRAGRAHALAFTHHRKLAAEHVCPIPSVARTHQGFAIGHSGVIRDRATQSPMAISKRLGSLYALLAHSAAFGAQCVELGLLFLEFQFGAIDLVLGLVDLALQL